MSATAPARPWRPGTATGVGSLPGADALEAARTVVGELPDLPHLPELPGRGAGSDLVGRGATLLVDLHVDLQPSEWRLVDRPGADERRARAQLRADLDALEEAAEAYAGPLKVQVAGPLTLAALLEQTRGDRVLADAGARRDLAQSLAEGVALHVAEVARRVPGADPVLLQLDEPSLPAVLAGAIPTVSGFGRLRSVAEPEAVAALRLVGGGSSYVVHCCAADLPVAAVARAGAAALSFDLDRLGRPQVDAVAEAVDGGVALWPGVVPSVRPAGPVPAAGDLAARVERLWSALGLDAEAGAAATVVTPSCGLAGADPAWARTALALARDTARRLADLTGLSESPGRMSP